MLQCRCCRPGREQRGCRRMYGGIGRRGIELMLLMPCNVLNGSSHMRLVDYPGSRESVDGEGY